MGLGIPIALAAFGAGISKIGQDDANEANSEEAQKNRDFQREMSNTQYQRAVADMRAAGLNPGLAYEKGGAGNVSGSTAASMQNALSGAAQATQAIPSTLIQKAQLANIEAQTQKTQAEMWGQVIDNKYANERYSLSNTNTAGQNYVLAEQQQQLQAAVRRANIEIETLSQTQKNTIDASKASLREAVAKADSAEIQAKTNELERRLRELGIPEAEAYANYYASPLGKAEPYIGAGSDIISAAKNALPWSGLFGSAKANSPTPGARMRWSNGNHNGYW